MYCTLCIPTTFLIPQGIFSPLQGFLNAIVYGWSRREFRRAVINRTERMRFTRSQEAAGSRYQSLNRSGIGGRGASRRVNTDITT